ncbi:MAG: hypothetical protein K940chlam2_01423 [Chlamydiae bacterium]|nr:hypothetical protein [Chlamydiota bacterium]
MFVLINLRLMRLIYLLLICLVPVVLGATVPADKTFFASEKNCWCDYPLGGQFTIPVIGTLKYRGGKGRSYPNGYESAEVFTALHKSHQNSYPFLDLKLHRVGEGRAAANCGLGWRTFSGTREQMFGANAYFDYRSVVKTNLFQLGLGLEFLGKFWDFRGNGYIPLAKRRAFLKEVCELYVGGGSATCNRYEKAMWGIDAELGVHLARTKCLDWYAAVGTYSFDSAEHANTMVGGMGRAYLKYNRWLTLQYNITHDKVFHTQMQGEIALTMPLCCTREFWRCLYIPVERNNIIITEKFCENWCTNFP